MAKLSFDFPDDEARTIDDEADALGKTTGRTITRSAYLAGVVSSRHHKEIDVKVADDPKALGKLEGVIETQKAQIEDLTNRLAKKTEQAGLAGVEKKNNVNEQTLKEYGEQLQKEWQAKLDQKELENLRAEKKENDARIKELEEHKASNEKFGKFIDKVSQFGSEVVANNPAVVNKLAGLMGLPLDEPTALGELPEADQHCLDVGRAVVNEIDPSIQKEVMFVLSHLAKKPEDIKVVMGARPIAAALKLARQQQQQAATA